ncbi:hypothetical protein BH11PLA1_BH11PLA1_08380 [soil metagenome]
MTTHTTRHLRRTLLAIANQQRPADSITVTVDGDGADIIELIRACAAEFNLEIALVTRAHQGACRSAQVRNNGARAALARARARNPHAAHALIFFDGDCAPAPEALNNFEWLLTGAPRGGTARDAPPADLVIGHWITLSAAQTEAFDEAALRAGAWPARLTPEQLRKPAARQRRYRRQLLLRALGLAKPHKPKLASGNFAVRAEAFERVNGFDEVYDGYGQEDDDLGRRLARAKARTALGVDHCLVFHQWHPTRKVGDWNDLPGVKRFRAPYPIIAERGLLNGIAQPPPRNEVCTPASEHAASAPRPRVRTPSVPA